MRAGVVAAVAASLCWAAPASAAVSTGDNPQSSGISPPTPSVAPSESGTERDGEQLTGDDGSWPILTDTDFIWLRCSSTGTSCAAVTAAGDDTYTLTPADVGSVLKFRTRGTATLSGEYREIDAVTGVIDAISPTVNTLPSFTGTETDGQTLTGSPGAWDGTPTIGTFAYQWMRCTSTLPASCTNIPGANGSTYVLQDADATRRVRLQVTASRNENPGDNGTATSNASGVIGAIPPANSSLPTIAGTAQQGKILSATPGGWSGTTPLTFAYSWQRCDGSTCTGIASGSSYALAAADVGKQFKVVVTATGPGGNQATAESTRTAAVTAAPAAPGPTGGGGSTGGGSTTTPGSTTLRKLSPFPVVAIGGRVIGRRVLVSLLRVSRAPRGSVVTVTCRGRSCPFRRARRTIRRRAGLRIKGLERRLSSGTVITIIVRKGKTIGKYTRLRIRRGAPPARIDRCIRPGATRPSKCP